MSHSEGTTRVRRDAMPIVIAALLVLGYAIWRITLGASLDDDAYPIAVAVRLARGGRLFVDEMGVQALGSIPSVPFTWLWLKLFGLDGIVLASRTFYLAVACGLGFVSWRALRPSFGSAVSGIAVAAVFLAPPYNVLALSYNTVGLMASVVAVAAAWAAVRDRSPTWAAASGIAAASGGVLYPPLVVGVPALLIATVVLTRDRRVLLSMLLGAIAVITPFVLWAVLGPGVSAIRETLRYAGSVIALNHTVADRVRGLPTRLWESLGLLELLPMYALAVVAALLAWRDRAAVPRLAGWCAAFLPLAAAIPAASWVYQRRDTRFFGALPSSYLLILLAGMALPVIAFAVARTERPLRSVLWVAAVFSAVAAAAVILTTNSAWFWGMWFIGAAPFVMAVLLGWARLVSKAGRPALALAAASLASILVVGLTLSIFKDARVWKLDTRIGSGAYAGILTTSANARRIADIEAAGRRYVRPGDTVLFVGGSGGYLLTEGRPDTNVVWISWWGKANHETVDYLEAHGGPPKVAFVPNPRIAYRRRVRPADPLVDYIASRIGRAGGISGAREIDPLVDYVASKMTLEADANAFLVFVSR